jgi:hypothetical protein
MGVQEQFLIGRPEINPIRMLLAEDSDVIRRVLFDFLQDEPLIEIVGRLVSGASMLESLMEPLLSTKALWRELSSAAWRSA